MRIHLLIILFCFANIAAGSTALDTARIDQITGLKGKMNEKEGVYKVTFPRNDVKIVVDGWTMPPFMGLGTWAAFTATKDGAMVMGDTVLFEDEVNATMSAALDNGLNVTALHNHFFFDHPKVYFMHIEGEGQPRNWLALSEKFMTQSSKFARPMRSRKKRSARIHCRRKIQFRAEPLNEIFGTQGEAKDGMVKFTFGRPATMHGVKIGKDMGVNTWAAFAGTDDNAVVDGDFAVKEDELQAGLEIARERQDQHRRYSSAHDARTTTDDVFPLLGTRPRKRFGGAIKGGFFIGGLPEVSSPHA